ncbi:DsbA family protein [Congregibacter sp.]|uniref:DsbA family protein n=1 Tax=Congregibacter sp. TaxID=2744308 RepID=UPI003F6CAFFB
MNIVPLETDAPAIVYIDFKSPYAYLAVEPTRALERQLGMQFDWRPFVLDIPSYLGSARLGESGEVVEQKRSAEQWSGVKYAYYDCRRYASLYGLTIRGTEKIWDTHLVSAAMMWTRQISHAAVQHFIDSVYPRFWVRDLDLESEEVVAGLLNDGGLDGAAFLEWAREGGLAASIDFQHAVFDAGVYGVPTFVVKGECYFGREHLPRVRWQLEGCEGGAPDIANPLPPSLPEYADTPERIFVGVDDSLDSLRALPTLVGLLNNYPAEVHWLRITSREPGPRHVADEDNSRSAMHQRFRRAHKSANKRRYGVLDIQSDAYADAITDTLSSFDIHLSSEGPEQVTEPAMPGIVMLLDDEIFIGRQHLPLVEAKLGVRS